MPSVTPQSGTWKLSQIGAAALDERCVLAIPTLMRRSSTFRSPIGLVRGLLCVHLRFINALTPGSGRVPAVHFCLVQLSSS